MEKRALRMPGFLVLFVVLALAAGWVGSSPAPRHCPPAKGRCAVRLPLWPDRWAFSFCCRVFSSSTRTRPV